jgi:hypothetical protein
MAAAPKISMLLARLDTVSKLKSKLEELNSCRVCLGGGESTTMITVPLAITLFFGDAFDTWSSRERWMASFRTAMRDEEVRVV